MPETVCPRCSGNGPRCAGHQATLADLAEQMGPTLVDLARGGRTLGELADAVIPSAPVRQEVWIRVPPDGIKMLRETLCVAQLLIEQADARLLSARRAEHSERLGLLIVECDAHRPLGPDGEHGERHTETCGCEDK